MKQPFAGERWQAFRFLAPLLLFLTGFILVPIFGTFVDSLYREVTFLPRHFIGLTNYLALFHDPAFWQSVRFTLLFVLVSVPIEVALGLAVALVLNEPFPLRWLLRACVLIPWAIPAAVSARVFQLIYNYSYGAANELLALCHLPAGPVNWLGSSPGAFAAVVLADAWKTTPFAAIILLAGLAAIPGDLYAQARVDRARFYQRFLHITLPLLKPVLIVTLLFRTIDALRVFDLIYVLTGGGPGGSTMSLSLLGYQSFSAGDFGYGSAISVLLFLIAFILSLFYVRVGGFGQEGSR
jgi:multiple sugar transport system permease protein